MEVFIEMTRPLQFSLNCVKGGHVVILCNFPPCFHLIASKVPVLTTYITNFCDIFLTSFILGLSFGLGDVIIT